MLAAVQMQTIAYSMAINMDTHAIDMGSLAINIGFKVVLVNL